MSVALFTHLTKQLRRIMLAHVACLPVIYFSPSFIMGTNFEKQI
jgi:hypothetical protein